jgi:hypothetical protein
MMMKKKRRKTIPEREAIYMASYHFPGITIPKNIPESNPYLGTMK